MKPTFKQCPICKSSGRILRPGMMGYDECYLCEGAGKIPDAPEKKVQAKPETKSEEAIVKRKGRPPKLKVKTD